MDNNKNEDYELLHFEDAFPDGRLVDDTKDVNKNFRFREALELSKELGRPLTSEEMKRYEKSLSEMEGPFDLSKLPRVRINLKGLMKYAESQNKKVVELTEEEKNMFIEESDKTSCYLVAKHVDKEGSYLFKTQHGQELVDLKHELISIVGYDKIQLVTISRPSAFGEYEPYIPVETKQEFKEAVIKLQRENTEGSKK